MYFRWSVLVFLLLLGGSRPSSEFRELPRFWTNTGFCPIGADVGNTLLSDDVLTSLSIIGSLPSEGLSKIRVHWLLDLLHLDKSGGLDFARLDKFLDALNAAGLHPVVEFMSHQSLAWEKLVPKLIFRYISRYGIENVKKWGFETWNEPDLKSYNVLNFTTNDFMDYLRDLQRGFQTVFRTTGHKLTLLGPAGLFHNETLHHFCWNSVALCSKACPFDVISFHRKGNGLADDIVNGAILLQNEVLKLHPGLRGFKFANTEADPEAIWSIPREYQADVRYAVIVAETVILHWGAMWTQTLNLHSISHDNAFLSFHPHQFTQRTLLARFQINDTRPHHTQFFVKPVFCVLGMLGYLGHEAAFPQIVKAESYNVSVLETRGENFTSYVVAYNSDPSDLRALDWHLDLHEESSRRILAVEGLINGLTDPYQTWLQLGSPKFPSSKVRKLIRKSQFQQVLVEPREIDSSFHLKLSFLGPSVYLVRICDEDLPNLSRIESLWFKKVTHGEVLLFWSDPGKDPCLFSYEVFFLRKDQSKWRKVSSTHLPVRHWHFQPRDGTTEGCFRVRSVSLGAKKSPFSPIKCYKE